MEVVGRARHSSYSDVRGRVKQKSDNPMEMKDVALQALRD
jgi:hypothetical protein